MDIGADEIRLWHTRDNGWSDIGYHYVIKRDGTIEGGRPEEVPGAHTRGHNTNSIGICMVGGKARSGEQACNFTANQWIAAAAIVAHLKSVYGCEVYGHNDFDKGKTCPTFDAKSWASAL